MSKIFARAKVVEYSSDFAGESKPWLVPQDIGPGTQTSFQVMAANAVPKHGETDKNASSIVLMVEKKSSDPDAAPDNFR